MMTLKIVQWVFMIVFLNFSDAQKSVSLESVAQPEDYIRIRWNTLAFVEFEDRYNSVFQQFMPYPIFHENVQALDGKKVIISGYLIPLEETPNETITVLSANPYSSCYFCGGAGPETVMSVNTKGKMKKVDMDKRVTLKGTFKLNNNDLYALFYILNEAELVE